MISSESSTISGLRRISTPSAPVQKRKPATQRYQTTSGPLTSGGFRSVRIPSSKNAYAFSLLGAFHWPVARVGPEDHAAHRGDEQHNRGDLEGQQLVGQEQSPDLGRRSVAGADVGAVGEPAAALQADDDDHLGEERRGGRHRAERLPAR